MSSPLLPSERVGALLRLVGETHELAGQPLAAGQHLLRGLGALCGAPVGMMLVDTSFRAGADSSVHEFVDLGWATDRDRAVALDRSAASAEPALIQLRRLDAELAAHGSVTRRRVELVGDRDWYGNPHIAEHRLAAHVNDTLYSVRALSRPGRVHGLMLFRARGDRPFSEEDRELLALFHRECGWLLAGPPAPEELGLRLSPRRRDTLECLLAGRSVKETADRLGLSTHTVAEYVQALYRALGVRSRAELLARFIRAGAGRR